MSGIIERGKNNLNRTNEVEMRLSDIKLDL